MKGKWIAYPYLLWMVIFIVAPLVLVAFFAVVQKTDGGIQFTLSNLEKFMQPIYINILTRSLALAAISTAICLIAGYPAAMILAKKGVGTRSVLVVLFVIPMWMNFLLRTYAWQTLLDRKGLINTLLSQLDLPLLNILNTEKGIVLGMVYNFLPFMVLPIYTVLSKIDKNVIEAAQDLGANSMKVFTRVTFPLSLPGVMSGITMVFMPAVTTFVISRLLGGGHVMLVGDLIEQEFMQTGDWSFGSAVSLIMMIIILISMGIMSKYDKEQEGRGLW